MDSGLAETQFILDSMEYRINQHYGQAQKELEEKINKFYKDFTRLDTEKLKLVNDGKLSMDDYKKWRQAKVMSGKVWEQRKATIAADLHNANDIAQSMIWGYMPDVYAANHNFATYQIEQQGRIDTSYTLYNHEAVEKLIAEQPDLIPYQRINEKLDISWNKKNIQAVMIQGILQGESIPHLAKRLAKNVVQKDKNAAIRNARTMTTAAQNAGKYDAFERAVNLGVKIKTQWRAVLDDRTRDRHRELDGMTVDFGEEFPNGLRYPVDIGRHMGEITAQSAEGRAICAETYNCRCNIKPIIDGLEPRAEKYRSTEAVGIPYEEWKKGHKAANEYRKAHGMLEHDRKGNVIIPKTPVSMRAKSHLDPSEVKKSEFKPKAKQNIGANLPKYVPKNTLSEIKDYLLNTLGLDTMNIVDSNTSVKALNIVADEITKVYNVFGDISKKGTLKNIMVYEGRAHYVAAYSPPANTLIFRKKSMKLKDPLKTWGKEAKEQYSYGFWSNDSPENAIRHELGHAIHKAIYETNNETTIKQMRDIEELRQSIIDKIGLKRWTNSGDPENMKIMKKAGEYLSYYGMKDDHEFVAECVAEYMTGKPRETAKKCVEILLRK